MSPLPLPKAFALLALGVVAAIGAAACAPNPSESAEDRASRCVECHMPEYRKAKDPVHVDVKPMTCGVCHRQEGWRPSVVDHRWWPLDGAHTKAECSYCHKGKPALYKGTKGECVDCHREDFDGSKFPGHAQFPTTCTDCHTTTAWKPTTRTPQSILAAEKQPDTLPPSDAGAPDAKANTPPPPPRPRPRPIPTPNPTDTNNPPPPPPPIAPPPPPPAPPDVTTRPSPRRR